MSVALGKRRREESTPSHPAPDRSAPQPAFAFASPRSSASSVVASPPSTDHDSRRVADAAGLALRGKNAPHPPESFTLTESSIMCSCDSEVCAHRYSIDGRSEMESPLYAELYGKTAFDVSEMWLSFPVTESARAMVEYAAQLSIYDLRRCVWTTWPVNLSTTNVLDFFFDVLARLRHRWAGAADAFDYAASGSIVLENGYGQRATDFVVVVGRHRKRELPLSWRNVRVVGAVRSNAAESNLDDTVLQVADYAREAFRCQPNRRWVHAFTLCGSELRVWRFNRAGACGSTLIDIHEQPEQFLAAITAYAMMSATDVGFDPSILFETDAGEAVFDPTVHVSGKLAAGDAAEDTHCPTPDDACPYIYAPITTLDTSEVDDTALPPLLPKSLSAFPCTGWTALSLDPEPISSRFAIVASGSVCWKARKRCKDSPWLYVVKDQWRSSASDPEGCFLRLAEEGTEGVVRYLWHSDIFILSSDGRLHLDGISSLRPPSAFRSPATLSSSTNTGTNLFYAGCSASNRVHTRLLSGPVGRPLRRFGTYSNLLICLKQAIEGHRYMYTHHHILHRDVSENNILLNPTSPGGFLIDFDLAIRTDRANHAGAGLRTGTFNFMAIDILVPFHENRIHTPLHDLESFFYVLLWLCIYYTKTGQRREPETPTIFTLPLSRDPRPWELAGRQKHLSILNPTFFSDRVLTTLDPEARECLAGTLDAWRMVILLSVGKEAVGVVSEEAIARSYKEVINILEEGLRALGGR
ncbi:hypothetical protein FN846DRAFT_348490 [Sphaerosporella brunnea]|uniref:EKC/KEOPS complex subunit BUD32 n=1 Tax=Sphaerosporella brunnea TaxID=1250544 RepID=A0A5J5EIW8_9PEZI|nr:hypothetical protein FN846DRAFT_348490 [Sphaerosporella brunnea]